MFFFLERLRFSNISKRFQPYHIVKPRRCISVAHCANQNITLFRCRYLPDPKSNAQNQIRVCTIIRCAIKMLNFFVIVFSNVTRYRHS